jgi:ferritin-like metal-binding protein YciE
MLTAHEIAEWTGRVAQDPYGEAIGPIIGALHDRETGEPEWLVVGDDGEREGWLVPVAGAIETGRRIRVVSIAETVRSAPRTRLGDELDVAAKRRVAAHYGLALDAGASGSGQLRSSERASTDGGAPGLAGAGAAASDGTGAHDAPLADAPPAKRNELTAALRAAHALEQASLKLLAAMRWRAQDEELVHDLALHHKATNRHAERLRERLDELEVSRARPLEWAAKLAAYAEAQRGRFRSPPDPHDIEEALTFERREIEAYDALERLADSIGDARTAEMAHAIRADEVAMLTTLEGHRLRADPGARRRQPSPFAAPEELAELSPKS